MTNELIAECIKNGSKNELIPVLWERVRPLMYMKSDRIYRIKRNDFSAVGVEAWDIKQECYFAFLEALKAYKPESELKFVSYLEYPFRKVISDLLGHRLSKKGNDPLNSAVSLEKPSARDESICLGDTLEDRSVNITEMSDNRTDREIIMSELDKLNFRQRLVIILYYYNDKGDTQIADCLGISPESAGQLRRRTLSLLRRSAVLRELYYSGKCCGHRGFLPPDRFYLKYRNRS
ncbi:MAG: sigma-70 family RNA polymerase sigma factor [Porcipelethomonas sp.]